MDFMKLNSLVAQTIDKALHEVNESLQKAGINISDAGVKAKENREALFGQLPGKLSGTLLTVFGGVGLAGFGIPMLILSAIGFSTGSMLLLMLGMMAFGPLTVAAAGILKKGLEKKSRIDRFEIYKRCIGTKCICAIRTMAKAVGKKEKSVCEELESLIAGGYLPQGHIDEEKTCFMLDDETYRLYLQSKRNMETAAQEDAAKKKAEASQKGSKQDARVQEAIELGMQYIRQIQRINKELPEPVITAKLTHLEQVIGLIYLRVQKTPEKLNSLKRFTDYYLPTTLRLVENYRELAGAQLQTANILESKRQIEATLDTINAAFDKLLDSLYEEARMNIQTDIYTLKTLLAQEGLTDDGLHGMTSDIFTTAFQK